MTGPRARVPEPGDPEYREHLARLINGRFGATMQRAAGYSDPTDLGRAVVAMPEVRALLEQATRPAAEAPRDEIAELAHDTFYESEPAPGRPWVNPWPIFADRFLTRVASETRPAAEQAGDGKPLRCTCDYTGLIDGESHRDYCERRHPDHPCDWRSCRFGPDPRDEAEQPGDGIDPTIAAGYRLEDNRDCSPRDLGFGADGHSDEQAGGEQT